MINLNNKSILLKIFIMSLAVRLIVVAFDWHKAGFRTWEYEIIANNILNGLGYRFDCLNTVHYIFGPPLYTFLIATIYYFTNHSHVALIVFQVFMSSVTCIFIFEIARRMFDNKTGILVSLLVALHPGLAMYSGRPHPFTLDTLLFTVTFLMLLRVRDKLNIKDFLLLGTAYGLSLLTRTTILFFLPLAFIYLFFNTCYKKRISFYFALSFIMALLIISPWLIRNYSVLHKWVFIQKSGEVFWRGNNPNASGTSYTLDGKPMIYTAPKTFLSKVYDSDEIEQDRLFWGQGLDFIKHYPLSFLILTMKKFYYFWYFSPNSGFEYPKLYLYVYKILYIPAFLFAIFGAFLVLNHGAESARKKTHLLLLLLFAVSFTQSFFYVEGRHRLAVEPLLLIFTAHGLMHAKSAALRFININKRNS